MNKINNIVVHCSDSFWGCARAITQWHKEKGWTTIGYHFVINNAKPTFTHERNNLTIPALDGAIECGRYLDTDTVLFDEEVGAHALGYNRSSIGICLIGAKTFTIAQHDSLIRLSMDLMMLYGIPVERVIGHYETESGKKQGKTCPNIDMEKVRQFIKFKQMEKSR